MAQTLEALKKGAAEIKAVHKTSVHKKQVAELFAALDRQKEKTRAEEARAELAERQVRQVAAERDIWKHQAQQAQAKLKSMGEG